MCRNISYKLGVINFAPQQDWPPRETVAFLQEVRYLF